MNPTLEQICRIGIIPIIAIDDAKKAVPLACSLVERGPPAAEVTFRICATGEAMRTIAAEVPEMLLSAGTILNHERMDRALAAGAKSIVSPGFNSDTMCYVKPKGGLILPGTATPGEMKQAMAFRLEAAKFFPAERNGGVAKLKTIAGPYKALKWIPTGDISAKSLMDYLSFDQVVVYGGIWMVKKDLIKTENWAEITRLTREAVNTMSGFNLAYVGINCLNTQVSKRTARTTYGPLGLPSRAGNDSNHTGTAVECTEAPSPGIHGHITTGINSVERTIYHLERHGVTIDHATCRTDVRGRAKAVYLEGDFGGFAIHLVQK